MNKHHQNVELSMDFLCKLDPFRAHKIREDIFQVIPNIQYQREIWNYIYIKTSEDQI